MKTNQYQQAIAPEIFDGCPKAVFAAIAVSFIINHQEAGEKYLNGELVREWYTLHMNGIVPQPPPKVFFEKYPVNKD